MSDPLLTSLCSICHVRSHKYCCPRCFTLTCSLPCIKRHKQWAECNGVRDPTKYMRQKDLATPKGIDHDYNYLTSIERQLDLAEKNATSRGVVTEEGARPKGQHYGKREKALENALERCGVVVSRAPKGISRNKMNATRLTNKTKILRWTVEWVRPDGTKTIGMCQETQPLSEAYAAHLKWLNPDRPIKKRKASNDAAQRSMSKSQISQTPSERPPPEDSRDLVAPTISIPDEADSSHFPVEDSHSVDPHSDVISSPAGAHKLTHSQLRKRRRRFQIERATLRQKARYELDSDNQLQQWKEAIDSKRKAEEVKLEIATNVGREGAIVEESIGEHSCTNTALFCKTTLKEAGCNECDESMNLRRQRISNGDKTTPNADDLKPERTANSLDLQQNDTPPITQPTSDAEVAFYLHHPSLPSRHPVLIPLPPTSILATALSNRLVLEFPTIYVLHPQSDGKLPEGFISEDEFFQKAKKELVQELEEGEVGEDDHEESVEDGQRLQGHPEVDEKRLAEVLGKDLNGALSSL